MKKLLSFVACLLLLSPLPGFATPSQDEVHAKFAALLKKDVHAMLDAAKTTLKPQIDAALAQVPEGERDQYRQQLEQAMAISGNDEQMDQVVAQAFEAFQPELAVSDDDARRLLAQGPDDVKNRQALDADKKSLAQSPSALPKPELLNALMSQPDGATGWDLELLRRLADGTVRQLQEQAAKAPK